MSNSSHSKFADPDSNKIACSQHSSNVNKVLSELPDSSPLARRERSWGSNVSANSVLKCWFTLVLLSISTVKVARLRGDLYGVLSISN